MTNLFRDTSGMTHAPGHDSRVFRSTSGVCRQGRHTFHCMISLSVRNWFVYCLHIVLPFIPSFYFPDLTTTSTVKSSIGPFRRDSSTVTLL